MVNMLELKKLVQGCFPSFIVTVLWMNLDKVSRDAHIPSLFSTFIRCAVPPGCQLDLLLVCALAVNSGHLYSTSLHTVEKNV